MSLPPGPSSPRTAQTLRWLIRPLPFMQECRQRYGEAFSVVFIGFKTPLVFVSDPEAVKAIYSEPANTLPPGRNLVLEPIMGPRSLLLLEGREHLARRKLMLPPFHGERMRSYEALMRDAVNAEIDSWPLNETFAIHPRMQLITLDVILGAVFGLREGPRFQQLREQLGQVLNLMQSPMAQLVGLTMQRLGVAGRFGRYRRFQELLDSTDALLFEEIEARRADPDLAEREDILSMLVAARFEDGEPISDSELRDQLMTLLLAGHETTATALAWTFDLLLRAPAQLSRLRSSLDQGGEDYLRATISEALRLRPVIPLAGRRLAADLDVGGLELPAGTDVTPAIWLTHTRADIYPEPFAFRPERFLDSDPETYSWIPFGGGVRRCIGAAFAEFEMRVVLGEVLRRCTLEAASERAQHVARRNITLSPREGTPVRLKRRTGATHPEPAVLA